MNYLMMNYLMILLQLLVQQPVQLLVVEQLVQLLVILVQQPVQLVVDVVQMV